MKIWVNRCECVSVFLWPFCRVRDRDFVSDEDDADLLRLYILHAPIVEVEIELAVADAELELLEDVLVLHDVQRIEDIHIQLLGLPEQLKHTVFEATRHTHVVEWVAHFEQIVLFIVEDLARQVVERENIGQVSSHTVNEGKNNILAR